MGEEEENGGKGESRALQEVAGKELWWENASHHYKATHLSGYVTGLGLLRLCITPSTRLKNLHHTASEMIQTDQSRTNHHLISFILLSFVSEFPAIQVSRCGYSLPTLLKTKPPYFLSFLRKLPCPMS